MQLNKHTTTFRFTSEQIEQIKDLFLKEKPYAQIAKTLGVPHRTITDKITAMRREGALGYQFKTWPLKRTAENCRNPLVRQVLKRAIYNGDTLKTLGERSGVASTAIAKWDENTPTLANFLAVANAVGYRLELVAEDVE